MSETEISPEDREKELAKLKQSNQDKYTALVRDGGRIDPASVMALRVETFFDTFLGDEDRLVFELNFEARMQASLTQALAQSRQARITAGTQNPQGLFIPGK